MPIANANKKISLEGIKHVSNSEGLYLEAYPDPASVLGKECQRRKIPHTKGGYRKVPNWQNLSGAPWTIGYGHTGPEVVAGLVWTVEQCLIARQNDFAKAENSIKAFVNVELTQNQFDALTSFVYNIGRTGFKNSSVLQRINARKLSEVPARMALYNKAGDPLVFNQGVANRRAKEIELWNKP